MRYPVAMQKRPVMRTRVLTKNPPMTWAWIGIGVLSIVGVLAVVHGERHENEHQRKKV
jgi:hypothetical protein